MTQSYLLRECPYCHKHYANVRNHIHMKHQVEPAVLTPADLLGESKPTTPEPEFFCTSCQAIVRRGESECWQCGAELEWASL